MIFLLKFKRRTGGNPPSPLPFPSWGECSKIFPPVVPHANDGLLPSTARQFHDKLQLLQRMQDKMQDNDVHLPTTTSPWWICWPILNVNAGISMISYMSRSYANTSCDWCFLLFQILSAKSPCWIASSATKRSERDFLTYLRKRCSINTFNFLSDTTL